MSVAGHGRAAVGIDLSAGMVAAARRAYPDTEFRKGDFLDLPARDGEFGAVVAFYSIIHLAPGELAPAFQEIIRRVLAAGGRVLVSFHVGSEVRHLEQWWGLAVDIDFRFLEVADVAEVMERAGFSVEARLGARATQKKSRRRATNARSMLLWLSRLSLAGVSAVLMAAAEGGHDRDGPLLSVARSY